MIILGDFGFFWAPFQTKEELYWLNTFANKRYQVCFLDGNHENYNMLNLFKEVDFYGGKAGLAHKSDKGGMIFHLKRGQIYTMDGNTLFTFGGAASTDKEFRRVGLSWWPEEEASCGDIFNADNSLENVGAKVDFILTHTCPTDIMNELNAERALFPCATRKFLDHVEATTKFREWHHGHMHKDVRIGRFFCHYNAKPHRII